MIIDFSADGVLKIECGLAIASTATRNLTYKVQYSPGANLRYFGPPAPKLYASHLELGDGTYEISTKFHLTKISAPH